MEEPAVDFGTTRRSGPGTGPTPKHDSDAKVDRYRGLDDRGSHGHPAPRFAIGRAAIHHRETDRRGGSFLTRGHPVNLAPDESGRGRIFVESETLYDNRASFSRTANTGSMESRRGLDHPGRRTRLLRGARMSFCPPIVSDASTSSWRAYRGCASASGSMARPSNSSIRLSWRRSLMDAGTGGMLASALW
jgi:hypothetical protein